MYLSCMAMPESPGQRGCALEWQCGCVVHPAWLGPASLLDQEGAGVFPACLLVRKGHGFYQVLVLLKKPSLLVTEQSVAAHGCL